MSEASISRSNQQDVRIEEMPRAASVEERVDDEGAASSGPLQRNRTAARYQQQETERMKAPQKVTATDTTQPAGLAYFKLPTAEEVPGLSHTSFSMLSRRAAGRSSLTRAGHHGSSAPVGQPR